MVERIRSLCRSRNINFSRLEKELGFANGSLKKSKEDKISAERVMKIANYFHVTMEYVLCGDAMIQNSVYTSDEINIIDAYRRSDTTTKTMVFRCLGIEETQKREIG